MDERDGCAEFVGGVGGEFGDSQECGFDPAQHFVQRIGEALQLIPGLQLLEAAAEVVTGDGAGGACERVDGGERSTTQPVASGRSAQQQQRGEPLEILAEIIEGLDFFVHGMSDSDDVNAPTDVYLFAEEAKSLMPEFAVLVKGTVQLIERARRKRVLFKKARAVDGV